MAKRKNIALFVSILDNEFCHSVIEGAMKGAEDYDAHLYIFPLDLLATYAFDLSSNYYRYQYNILDSFLDVPIFDGVIIEYGTVTSLLSDEDKKIFLSKLGNKPTVLLSENVEGYTCLCADNTSGLSEIMCHLIEDHQYKKIAFLSGHAHSSDANARLEVYKKEMTSHGLYCGDDYIMYGNFSIYVEELVTEFINKHPDIEAIVCANDAMAIGAMTAISKLGLVPGKDIAVTGFDNLIEGYLSEPSITTVNADPSDLSYRAVQLLCGKQIDSNLVKTKMVCRESCGCHSFSMEEKWKTSIGISTSWRETAQLRINENTSRLRFESELSNITRELVYKCDSEKERYDAILNTLKRMDFFNAGIFLFDSFVEHSLNSPWKMPEVINLVGYYERKNSSENFIYSKGEYAVPTHMIFAGIEPSKIQERIDVVILPLFFAQYQIGILIAGGIIKDFLYAQLIAGQISTTLYTVSIIEEQKRIQNELIEANHAKSQFLANMSHEIRTPINAMIGFNEMILRENHDETINDYAMDVKNAAQALLLIVNNILDFSKIEAGKMDLVIVDYSLPQLLDSIISMVTERAEKKGLALYLNCTNDIPPCLQGDSGRIQQILINLLSNAIKYTEKGTVTLSVDCQAQGEDALVTFKVTDTGIGIKSEDIEKLFNEFERLEAKRNRNIEGTGLGINITTGLLDLMGSKLNVASEYGHGSEFSFTLRQKVVKSSTSTENDEKSSKASSNDNLFTAPELKILIVDDNTMNRKVLCSLLKITQVQIDQAESGAKCIEMVKSNTYDLILLDHMMPEMDGIEALTQMLDQKLLDTAQTPVIALTANAIAGVKEMYLDNGFSDYLSKPVHPKDLYSMIIKHSPAGKIQLMQ